MIKLLLPFFIILAISTNGVSVRCADSLEHAAFEQQKAITQLIGAMKHIRKARIRSNNSGGANKEEKSIFKDDQEFQMPELNPNESLENKLQEISEKEQEIIDKLKSAGKILSVPTKPLNSENVEINIKDANYLEQLTEKQGKAMVLLKDIIEKEKELPDIKRNLLKQALKSGEEALLAMESDNSKISELKVRQTKAYIDDVLRELQKKSDENQQSILDNLQKTLNEMGKKQSGKEAAKLRKIAETLKKEAIRQNKSGRQNNAAELAELAKEFGEKGDKKNIDKKLEQLKESVRALRESKKEASAALEEAGKKIKEFKKQLEYIKKHPESMTGKEKKELLKNMELAMQDAAEAIKKLEGISLKPGKEAKIGSKGDKGKKSAKGNSSKKGNNGGTGNKGDNGKNGDKGKKSSKGNSSKKGNNGGTGNKGDNGNKNKIDNSSKQLLERINQSMRSLFSNYDPDFFVKGTRVKHLGKTFDDILVVANMTMKNIASSKRKFLFKNDEVPEKYRDEVSRYFEALSEAKNMEDN